MLHDEKLLFTGDRARLKDSAVQSFFRYEHPHKFPLRKVKEYKGGQKRMQHVH